MQKGVGVIVVVVLDDNDDEDAAVRGIDRVTGRYKKSNQQETWGECYHEKMKKRGATCVFFLFFLFARGGRGWKRQLKEKGVKGGTKAQTCVEYAGWVDGFSEGTDLVAST